MALQIACTCGYVFRADDEDGLWAKGLAHVTEQHPEMAGAMTREDMLSQAEMI